LANLPDDSQPNGASSSTAVLLSLGYRGMCQQIGVGWQINGGLLHDFVQTAVQRGLGRIWQDGRTGALFQGSQRLVGLRPLEEALLAYLVQHPYKPHTKSELIGQVWPEGTQIEGVTDDSLYQVVRGVRQKIEPETAVAPVYLLTKRGVDEGGYQFFPEGNPVT
jgi:DNA-binding response OmpR family regulator